MKPKIVAASVVIVVFVIFGAYSFLDSNLEYTNIDGAIKTGRKVQLVGTWNKDKKASFDPRTSTFTFYLIDDAGRECKVVLDGAAPNNFELATSVVAKGRYVGNGTFEASELLTKCPSKYEAEAAEVGKAG